MKRFFSIIFLITSAYGGYVVGVNSGTDIPCIADQPAPHEYMDND